MFGSLFDIFVLFQIIGSFLGMLGAYLNKSVSVNTKIYGFEAWIISNIVLLVWAVSICAVYIAIMYVFFLYTAVDGLRTHLKLKNDNDHSCDNGCK